MRLTRGRALGRLSCIALLFKYRRTVVARCLSICPPVFWFNNLGMRASAIFLLVDVRSWHEADIKLRPLFGRYGVESGHHRLVMSISAFDPKRTSAASPSAGSLIFDSRRPSGMSLSVLASVHNRNRSELHRFCQ